MDNRKHMRTEKKTADKKQFWTASGYRYICTYPGCVAGLSFIIFLQGLRMDFIIKHIYCNYSCA